MLRVLAFDPGGLKYGVAIFVSIILVGMLSRLLLRKLRLLYLPRVAITLTIGILTSMFTSVTGTHSLVTLIFGRSTKLKALPV